MSFARFEGEYCLFSDPTQESINNANFAPISPKGITVLALVKDPALKHHIEITKKIPLEPGEEVTIVDDPTGIISVNVMSDTEIVVTREVPESQVLYIGTLDRFFPRRSPDITVYKEKSVGIIVGDKVTGVLYEKDSETLGHKNKPISLDEYRTRRQHPKNDSPNPNNTA